MLKKDIKTYNTPDFRAKHILSGEQVEAMFHPGFDRFFIVKVEDMIRQMRLPVPPSRAITHSIIFLTSGEAVMSVGSEKFQIFKDECLIAPAGQVFSFDNLDINTGYLLNFHPDFPLGKFAAVEGLREFDFLQIWGNPRIVLGELISGFVHNLMLRMYKEYAANGLKNADLINTYLIAVLCEMNQVYKETQPRKQGRFNMLANRFQELLFIHFREKQLVSDYAEILHVSPNHLNKVVKKDTGKSPGKWIDDTLMLEAKVLLHQTQLSISEIASSIGLYDASYFSRLFKKYENETPQEFRKRIEKS